jgi:DNA repair exonuclease SbcCD ATPase subunit
MTTIAYTTGNGYYCSCCGRTQRDDEYFDEDTLEKEIIDRMSDIAVGCEDWRGIYCIYEYSGDSDELENKIDAEIARKTKIKDLTNKIKSAKSTVQDIDQWFANLEKEKAQKISYRERNLSEIETLQQELNQLGE